MNSNVYFTEIIGDGESRRRFYGEAVGDSPKA
jgi:hypothetical protein